jgi:hypothetical protein
VGAGLHHEAWALGNLLWGVLQHALCVCISEEEGIILYRVSQSGNCEFSGIAPGVVVPSMLFFMKLLVGLLVSGSDDCA